MLLVEMATEGPAGVTGAVAAVIGVEVALSIVPFFCCTGVAVADIAATTGEHGVTTSISAAVALFEVDVVPAATAEAAAGLLEADTGSRHSADETAAAVDAADVSTNGLDGPENAVKADRPFVTASAFIPAPAVAVAAPGDETEPVELDEAFCIDNSVGCDEGNRSCERGDSVVIIVGAVEANRARKAGDAVGVPAPMEAVSDALIPRVNVDGFGGVSAEIPIDDAGVVAELAAMDESAIGARLEGDGIPALTLPPPRSEPDDPIPSSVDAYRVIPVIRCIACAGPEIRNGVAGRGITKPSSSYPAEVLVLVVDVTAVDEAVVVANAAVRVEVTIVDGVGATD